jgi:methylthioribose-1-phosphate isomerase
MDFQGKNRPTINSRWPRKVSWPPLVSGQRRRSSDDHLTNRKSPDDGKVRTHSAADFLVFSYAFDWCSRVQPTRSSNTALGQKEALVMQIHLTSLEWRGSEANGYLRILDQTQLPGREVYRNCQSAEDVWQAIRHLQVRGAPAIGVAAAYGVVLGLRSPDMADRKLATAVAAVANYLATARPTAVNLFHALDYMRQAAKALPPDMETTDGHRALLAAAQRWHQEDIDLCAAIAEHGASLIADGAGVLTYCNTGALATAGVGTALGCLRRAAELGRQFTVFACETRPLLQGARLTAWELQQAGFDPILICDNMAGHLMRSGRIQLVIVGADRIAANGDTANKIGTYTLAVLAQHHHIPFYVAAPRTTFDWSLPDGSAIRIEERPSEEVTHWLGQPVAPPGIRVCNPAFDVTPGTLITGFITEKGVFGVNDLSADWVRRASNRR